MGLLEQGQQMVQILAVAGVHACQDLRCEEILVCLSELLISRQLVVALRVLGQCRHGLVLKQSLKVLFVELLPQHLGSLYFLIVLHLQQYFVDLQVCADVM